MLKLVSRLVRGAFFIAPTKLASWELHRDTKKSLRGVAHTVLYAVAKLEYLIYFWRFYFVAVPYLITILVMAGLYLFGKAEFSRVSIFIAALNLFLIYFTVGGKTFTDLRLVQLLTVFGSIHPEDFFVRYKMELAFGGIDVLSTSDLKQVNPYCVDFTRDNRSKLRLLPLIKGIIDTGYIAHCCLTIYKVLGQKAVFDIFDVAAALWGKRLLQLGSGRFVLKGAENLIGKQGKFILIFNHKSMFDFIVTHCALSHVRVGARCLRPRFILAKDHFKDNKLIYSVLGMGKLCEAINMVFIARNDRGKSFSDLKQATNFIVQKDIDIAIYPQGTRADGNYDRAGKRRDAGYYTTISKRDPAAVLSHLKKGTGYLVYDTLLELHEQKSSDKLNLVFIGIKGTGTTLPKGSFKVQTENEIEFVIGEVVTLTSDIATTIESANIRQFASDINGLVNERLTGLLAIHDILVQRYLTELKGQFRFDNDKIEFIYQTITRLASEADTVYYILDRIYSLPLVFWNRHLSELSQLLQERVTNERLEHFLAEVSEELLRA